MGYDVKSFQGGNWQNRRRRIAMEILQGNFSDDPNSDVFYGSTGRKPSNSLADGFVPLTGQVMRWLDFSARARTGRYDAFSSDDLDTHCDQTNAIDLAAGLARGRYDGYKVWKGQPLDLPAYISLVEQADWRYENPGGATEPERAPASPVIVQNDDDVIDLISDDEDPPPNPQEQKDLASSSDSTVDNASPPSDTSVIDLVNNSDEDEMD